MKLTTFHKAVAGISLFVVGLLIWQPAVSLAASKKNVLPPTVISGISAGNMLGGYGCGGFGGAAITPPGMGCGMPGMWPSAMYSQDFCMPGGFPGGLNAPMTQFQPMTSPSTKAQQFLVKYKIFEKSSSGKQFVIVSGENVAVAGEEPATFQSIQTIPYLASITNMLADSGQIVALPTMGEANVGADGFIRVFSGSKDIAINYCVHDTTLFRMLEKNTIQKPVIHTEISKRGNALLPSTGVMDIGLGSYKGSRFTMTVSVHEIK